MAIVPAGPTVVSENKKEIQMQGDTVFPAACYGFYMLDPVPWHWHEELELIVVTEGILNVFIEGERITVSAGSGIFINGSKLHMLERDTYTRIRSCVFSDLFLSSRDSIIWQKFIHPIITDTEIGYVILESNTSCGNTIMNLFHELWNSCEKETYGYELTMRENLTRILYLLHQNIPKTVDSGTIKIRRETERIKLMLTFISEHLGEEINISMLSKSANISESECMRCFRHILNTTPGKQITKMRIQKAEELLVVTSLSVSEIAARCGYSEESYFIKCFKKMKDTTPTRYRNKAKRFPLF